MADIVKNCHNFGTDLRLCDLQGLYLVTKLIRFYEISVELMIFGLQYSVPNFGNPPLWTSL